MNCKSYPALLLAFFFCNHLAAQSLYNFKYEFKDEDEKDTEYYNAFMVRYEDGTGFIRVNFTDNANGEKYLVDMDMKESYDVNDKTGADDSSRLYFEGIDPVVLSGDTS